MSLTATFILPAGLLFAHPYQPPAPDAPAEAAAPMIVDSKAEAVLEANAKAMFALKSYRAACSTTRRYPVSIRRTKEEFGYDYATLTAVKPNRMSYGQWSMQKRADNSLVKGKYPPILYVIDGKKSFRQFGTTYREEKEVGPRYLYTNLEPWTGFYTRENSLYNEFTLRKSNKRLQELKYAGQQSFGGARCDVVTYKYTSSNIAYVGTLFLGPDKLVRRQIESVTFSGEPGFTSDRVIHHIQTNFPPPPAKTFVYTPAPGIKREDPAEIARRQAEAEAKRPKLLAVGTVAPDFTVEDLDGKPVKLSEMRGKTVVLDFWATWCGPCMIALPSTNAAGRKYKDSNVVVVAVNVWDEKRAFQQWVPKNQAKHDAIRFLLDPHGSKGDVAKTLYNVSGIPTQYIIDADGIIRATVVGFDDDPKILEGAIEAAQKPMPATGTTIAK